MASTGFHSRPKNDSGSSSDHSGLNPKEQITPEPKAGQAASKPSPAEIAAADQREAAARDAVSNIKNNAKPATAPEEPSVPPSDNRFIPPKPTRSPSIKAPADQRTKSGNSKDGLSALSDMSRTAGANAGSSTMKRLGRSINFAKRNRKAFGIGGGLAALLLALLIGFLTFLPLKLETMLKSIEAHEMARVHKYVSRRMDAIVYRYLYEKITGNLAADGFYSSPKGILHTLYGNMELNKFEEKLSAKGIKLTKTGAHSMSITYNGTTGEASSPAELTKYFDKDLTGRAARSAISSLVDETYSHPLQYLKRRHLRKYVKNAYNIRKWSVKKQEDIKDPAKPNLPTVTRQEIQADTIEPAQEMTVSSVDCALGLQPCPKADERKNPDGSSEFRAGVPDPKANGTETQAATETKKGIRDQYKSLKDSAAKLTADALTKAFGPAVTQAIFKAVPIVGWLSLAAELDNFFWNGTLHQVGVNLHSAQYAAVGMKWSSLADQAKAGDLTASQLNNINGSLDNMEKSNAVQRIFFRSNDAGLKLTEAQKVGSENLSVADNAHLLCSADWFYVNGLSNGQGMEPWTFHYRQVASFPTPFGYHTPLCFLRGALGQLTQFIDIITGGAIGKIFQGILDGVNAVATGYCRINDPACNVNVMDGAKTALSWMMNTIWTPVVTGRETGPELGNAIDAGWDVTANQSCRDVLGCKNISATLAYEQNVQIAAEANAAVRQRGLLASLFSTDTPQTLSSQLIARLPATPGTAITEIGTYTASIMMRPDKLFRSILTGFSPSSHAAEIPANDPNGVQQTGYTEADMADAELHLATTDVAGPPGADGKPNPVPDGRIDQYDCPVITDPTVTNQCLIDTAAAQVLCAGTTANDDGGLGGNGDPGPCGETNAPTADAYPAAPADDHLSFTSRFSFALWNLFRWNHS